ncbi:MAG: alpha-L-fucosidase [Armatimonadota bacterium]|jgi:alpha-L-fucosidase
MTPFEPTVESLQHYRCPKWFRDAKFGIYVHWGAYSVAEHGEWYARQLYIQGHPDYEHHVKTYGHPSEFGYKDFIPMWKAENFDPDALLGLFKRAGARYFAPCAIHHDNFDLWDSTHHEWNSVNMGPQKDITGLWREATLQHGLRFGVTTHLARSYSWFNTNKTSDSEGPKEGVPYDGANPELADFYFDQHDDTDRRQPVDPPEWWRKQWARRITDLIDNYHPDHLYFDGSLPFNNDGGRAGMEVVAHYYNHNMAQHDGRLEGVMCMKRTSGGHGRYEQGVATLDLERRRADYILPDYWQTDTSIGPWGYDVRRPYRPAGEIICELVDIVSKNGNMLLNVPPKADGTLDDETVGILETIGGWLDVNGDAIYGTRPWLTSGSGPARFTTKGNALYAICIELPQDGIVRIPELSAGPGIPELARQARVRAVRLLGHEGELSCAQTRDELQVTLPDQLPCEHAVALVLK